jgi:hypothetical protein
VTYPDPNQPSDPWGTPAPGWSADPSLGGHPGFAPLPPVPSSGPPVPPSHLAPTSGPGPDPGAVVAQIGELQVTSTVVRTPAGDIPLQGSTWHVIDYWHNETKIPTWAIVCAVAGFCVLTVFSLLFLLAKETIPRGTVQVTVTNGSRQYVARIPVTAQPQVAYVHQQVNYVRSLAAI